MIYRWLALLGVSLLAVASAGGAPALKILQAVRTDVPPELDGVIQEPQWQAAPPLLDFVQFDPEEGALPTEVTAVRVLYDDRALYVGVVCYDAHPDLIVRQLSRRDRTTEADRFTVMIDSYHDRQTAFLFSANVSGVQADGVLSQDGTVYDVTWDAVWSVKTHIYRDGWAAEFEIPYNALRFSREELGIYEWGINFRRYISRKRETDEWVMVPRRDVPLRTISSVSRMGMLTGIRDIRPPLHLTLLPYVSGKSTFHTATPEEPASSRLDGAGGLDVKYGLARNLTLDATINPDFGQVEVDQAVLNLTVFETLYPEKRPFFTEGAQFFTFGSSIDNSPLPIFFSRRIGRRPRDISPPIGDALVETPDVTTILGAAKLSGRSTSGLSVGILAAATDEEQATLRDSTGRRFKTRVEPRGSYNVVRLRQDFDGGSWLGGIGTFASRQFMPPALSGGVDWNLRLAEGTVTVDGYLAGVRSSAASGDRDGTAGRLLVSQFAAEHWLYTGSYNFYTPGFNTNDIGFFAQPHDHGGYLELAYQDNFASWFFRRYFVAFNPEFRWNWNGVLTQAQVNATVSGELMSFWTSTLTYTHFTSSYDDEERGIVGIHRRPPGHRFQLALKTDQRAPVSATLGTEYGLDAQQKREFAASLSLNLRPTPLLELTPTLSYQRVRKEETGAFLGGGIDTSMIGGGPSSKFGDRDVDMVDASLRGIVTFTRTLSLQFFSQVLIARGRYLNLRRLVSPGEFATDVGQTMTYDFNEVLFNANMLLRWEYLPGSTVYLVWTQQRYGDSGQYATGFGQRFGQAFTLPHEDVLLLKLSYWIPL